VLSLIVTTNPCHLVRLHAKQSRKRKKDFTEKLKEQTELLKRTKAYLEILPVIILSHNEEGTITHAVAATKRLLDYSSSEICGMNFYDLLGESSVDVARRSCELITDEGSDSSGSSSDDESVQVNLIKRGGEELLFEMDTKRPSQNEILRYLQLAKSNMSSSSSSSSEEGYRTNSGTSISTYESSEEGVRSNSNDGSNGTNYGTNSNDSSNGSNDGGSNDGNGSNDDTAVTTSFCEFTHRGERPNELGGSMQDSTSTSEEEDATKREVKRAKEDLR